MGKVDYKTDGKIKVTFMLSHKDHVEIEKHYLSHIPRKSEYLNVDYLTYIVADVYHSLNESEVVVYAHTDHEKKFGG
jgi:hypothetical protein